MLLEGKEARKKFVEVISNAASFCYVVAPWLSVEVAEDVTKYCSARDIRVLLYDKTEKAMEAVRVLKKNPNIQILRDPMLHGKAVLTDFDLMSGSGNLTFSAFNKNDEFIEFDKSEERRKEYFQKIMKWFTKSVLYEVEEKEVPKNNKKKILGDLWRSL